MKSPLLLTSFFLLASYAVLTNPGAPASAAMAQWNTWPAGVKPDDHVAFVHYPPEFKVIESLVPKGDDTLLNGRFRSADGSVEFALTVVNVRHRAPDLKSRVIPLPLQKGDKIVEKTNTQKTIKGEGGEYLHYDEAVTVAGAKEGSTRYFRLETTTARLPMSVALLWEYKATSERARKTFQIAYTKFTQSLNLGED